MLLVCEKLIENNTRRRQILNKKKANMSDIRRSEEEVQVDLRHLVYKATRLVAGCAAPLGHCLRTWSRCSRWWLEMRRHVSAWGERGRNVSRTSSSLGVTAPNIYAQPTARASGNSPLDDEDSDNGDIERILLFSPSFENAYLRQRS